MEERPHLALAGRFLTIIPLPDLHIGVVSFAAPRARRASTVRSLILLDGNAIGTVAVLSLERIRL
jgi:hypothetical protein